MANTLQAAIGSLRIQEYSAVVIDQFLLETEPDECDLMLRHLGSAVPIYVNCAISGAERIAREVRSALSRRQREEQTARRSAEQVSVVRAITHQSTLCDKFTEKIHRGKLMCRGKGRNLFSVII